MVFGKVHCLLSLTELKDPDIPGYQVSPGCVVTRIIREMRLHGQGKKDIQSTSDLMVDHFLVRTSLRFLVILTNWLPWLCCIEVN